MPVARLLDQMFDSIRLFFYLTDPRGVTQPRETKADVQPRWGWINFMISLR
jgi:hypothetical protein